MPSWSGVAVTPRRVDWFGRQEGGEVAELLLSEDAHAAADHRTDRDGAQDDRKLRRLGQRTVYRALHHQPDTAHHE